MRIRLGLATMLSLLALSMMGWAQGVGPSIYGFIFQAVKFDGGSFKPTPRIPKDWKFLSTSHGGAPNESLLWFQGPAGDLFVIHGFVPLGTNEFILVQSAQKIEAEK